MLRPSRPLANPRFRRILWVLAGVVGWAWLGLLIVALRSNVPPSGHDLELILEAGRRVAAGDGPYDPSLVNGTAVLAAADLFFSYPPPFAQAASVLAGMATELIYATLVAVAVVGFATVVALLGRVAWPAPHARDGRTVEAVLAAVAILPFIYPFAGALVVGNLDALYPLAYGLVLLAVAGLPRFQRGPVLAGGLGLAGATLAKLAPAGLGGWLLVRGLREREASGSGAGSAGGIGRIPASWQVLAIAVAGGLVVVAISLVAGGIEPWRDWSAALSTASRADMVIGGNIGPAAQLALLAGTGEDAARVIHLPVAGLALLVILASAWWIRDTITSLALASAASLVLLPLTWYHYPPALLPFAAAALIRAYRTPAWPRVALATFAAGVVAALSILLVVGVWLAVGLVLLAVHWSVPAGAEQEGRATEHL